MKNDPRAPTANAVGVKFSKQDFKVVLDAMLSEATSAGETMVEIRAGNLHARVGGYPGRGHSMPTCCSAMRDTVKPGDTVLMEPLKGQGVSLHIRYCLPR